MPATLKTVPHPVPKPRLPAGQALRRLALLQAALGLAPLGYVALQSEGALSDGARTFIAVLGGIMVVIGLAGPVRIVARGLQLPSEILGAIRVQAVFLVLVGAILVVGAALGTSVSLQFALVGLGIGAVLAAVLGFYRLSRRMPATFYFHEMRSIVKSAGVSGAAEDSAADRAFKRWAPGSAAGVPVGHKAPDGPMVKLSGEASLLSEYFERDALPLVVNFGSYSCPHHRKRLPQLEALASKWQPQGVRFVTIYTAEAHPEDGWRLDAQYEADEEFTQASDFCFHYAKSTEERLAMAERMIAAKQLTMEVVVDPLDDPLLRAYNSWPIRLYVIQSGKVCYSGDQGPFGYDPDGVDRVLRTMLDSKS